MTSQNKYKKKIIFDVIEEEEDEDKNKNFNRDKNRKEDLDINLYQSINTENKVEKDIFIDTKCSNIHPNANNLNKNNKNIFDINRNNSDKKIELLFDNKIKNINDKKINFLWSRSSNIKRYENNIFNKLSKDSHPDKNIFKESIKEKEQNLLLPNINTKNLYEKKATTNQIKLDSIKDLKNINLLSSKGINVMKIEEQNKKLN